MEIEEIVTDLLEKKLRDCVSEEFVRQFKMDRDGQEHRINRMIREIIEAEIEKRRPEIEKAILGYLAKCKIEARDEYGRMELIFVKEEEKEQE